VPSVADEVAVEDGVIVGIHELPVLAVPPPEDAHASADIRLDGRVVAKRQETERRRHRHDAKLEIRHHLTAVDVDEVRIHRVHGFLKEPETDARVELVVQRNQPLAAEREPIEVFYAEGEKLLVLYQHVIADASGDIASRISGGWYEAAHVKIYRLLG